MLVVQILTDTFKAPIASMTRFRRRNVVNQNLDTADRLYISTTGYVPLNKLLTECKHGRHLIVVVVLNAYCCGTIY
jgi:hypothetical protein